MLYREVEIIDGETKEPVQFVGVHSLRWPEGYTPTIAFIEDESATARLTAADALATATDALCQAIDEYTIEVGNAERGSSADQGELYERREAVAAALRQYREAK